MPRMTPQADPPARRGKRGWVWPVLGCLGLAILANDLAARAAERRHPPRGRVLDIDGMKLHVIEQGEGPPVLLLHGNGAMAEDFVASGLVDRLAVAHRVVVPDRPGFGHTPRPEGRIWTAHAQADLMARAMDQLGIREAIVLGHSWGALVALDLALNHSRKVAALVLVGGFFHPRMRLDIPLVSLSALPVLGTLLRHTVLPPLLWLLRRPLLGALFAPAPITARFDARFPLALALRPSQLRAVAHDTAMMIPGTAWLARRYAELRMPVAIVGGVEDRVVSFEHQSAWLHREILQSSLHPVLNDGHMVHHTEPALVADAVIQAGSAARAMAHRAA